MKTLATIDQFNELTNHNDVIMLFTADWCPDCRVIEPVLPEVEAAFPAYTFVLVDRDEFMDVCQEYQVFGIPSFLAFKNGKEVGRFVSKDRKTKEEIIKFIEGLPE